MALATVKASYAADGTETHSIVSKGHKVSECDESLNLPICLQHRSCSDTLRAWETICGQERACDICGIAQIIGLKMERHLVSSALEPACGLLV
jgi:hypothetical protein